MGDAACAQRVISDGYEVVEAGLLALATVSNELGKPRYPTLRGIMAAGRKAPIVWTAADLGLEPSKLAPRTRVTDLFTPVKEKKCEFIVVENEADAGRRLAPQ